MSKVKLKLYRIPYICYVCCTLSECAVFAREVKYYLIGLTKGSQTEPMFYTIKLILLLNTRDLITVHRGRQSSRQGSAE